MFDQLLEVEIIKKSELHSFDILANMKRSDIGMALERSLKEGKTDCMRKDVSYTRRTELQAQEPSGGLCMSFLCLAERQQA